MSEGINQFKRQKEKPASNQEVLHPLEFIRDFELEASGAKDKVVSQVMLLEADRIGEEMVNIYKSIPEGISKELIVDWYSKMVFRENLYALNRMIPWKRKRVEELKQQAEELFSKLESIGVRLTLVNPPRGKKGELVPFSGRDHLKWARVDERVFYIGGLNFGESAAESAEFMVKFTGEAARKLIHEFERIRTEEIKEDYSFPVTAETTFLYDVGLPGKSLILETAVRMIQSAESSIENVSTFVPDGLVARLLTEQSRNGKRVEVITSDYTVGSMVPPDIPTFGWLVSKINAARNLLEGNKIPIRKIPFHGTHAKLLIIDSKKALFGSHNLSEALVDRGTKEAAIVTTDPVLVSNLRSRFMDFRTYTLDKIKEVL